jgi:hypothetical protein
MGVASSGSSDVVAILEADHRSVETLFKNIQASGSGRAALVKQLSSELGLHMAIEESLVYPTLSSFDRKMSDEARAEHELARKVLRDVERLSPDKPGFDGALGMLRAGIQHHVQEEEGEALPQLRRELDETEMQQLADEVLAAKERGRAPRKASGTTGKRSRAERSPAGRSGSASKSAARTRSPSKSSGRGRSASSSSTRASGGSRRSQRNSVGETTKADLVRQARRAGVTGYSSMTKPELQRAVAR